MKAPRYRLFIRRRNGPDAPGTTDDDLCLVYRDATLSVWSTDHAIALGAQGVVIGHVFTRTLPSERRENFSVSEAEEIVRSGGLALIRQYWGGYVAVIRGSNDEVIILRDPSGAMPAFYREDAAGLHVATEVGDSPLALSDRIEIDPAALAQFLSAPHLLGAETCLSGVGEILPGQALQFRNDAVTRADLWSPWDHINPPPSRSIDEQCALLKTTAIDCIRSWGNCFSSIALGLSGGLDSSIVAAGLGHSSANITCLTMVGPDPSGDERPYADQVATTFHFKSEHPVYRLGDVDAVRPFLTHLPWPTGAQFSQAIATVHAELLTRHEVDAFFTGNGGDMVFCSMQSVTPVVDRILARSSPARTWATAKDVATNTGADLLTIARKVAGRLRGNPHAMAGTDTSFLNSAMLAPAALNPSSHLWLRPPSGTLPGKAAHVAMLKRSQPGIEFHHRASHPPTVSPLLAQPIVELCLGIPTWDWVEGGINRSMARKAFAGVLPAKILRRRSKGGPGGFMYELYKRDRDLIAHCLEKGALARLGILNSSLTHHDYLSPVGPSSPLPDRLLTLAMAEAWASAWTSIRVQ